MRLIVSSISYLTDTHGEVVRRLTEISAVLGDLMRSESAAGPLLEGPPAVPADEALTLPAQETPAAQDVVTFPAQEEPAVPSQEDVRVIVADSIEEPQLQPQRASDDTDVNIGGLTDVRK
ncbi:hypothetical protein AB0K48_60905 [Nonomuraea sp. NPDC055795]